LCGESGDQQDLNRWQAMSEEALALARSAGYPATIILCLGKLVELAFARHDYMQAAEVLQETLAISADSGWQYQLAIQLADIAGLAHMTGQQVRAAHVFGAYAAFRTRAGMPASIIERAQDDQFLAELRAVMAADAYAAAIAAGHALPLQEAIAVAKAILGEVLSPAAPPADAAPAPPYGLTTRELQVLRLLAEGLSDREIAERLFISPHTVMRHVTGVLGKLSVTSRTAAATLAVREGIA
jgi:DNA-binding NarL/FixJ family response regulator